MGLFCITIFRYGDDKPNNMTNFATPGALLLQNKWKSSYSTTIATVKTHHFSPPKSYHEVLVAARKSLRKKYLFGPRKKISLAKRLHWRRASRTNDGLMLTSPLTPIHNDNEKWSKTDGSSMPLFRPQYLRLSITAWEKLLILQPHNWALRRDHGMMLSYSRDYVKAVQELSICMAFVPKEEAEVLEPFVEKLHLLQLESSWTSQGHKGRLMVL
ncbi:hypothetical protein Ccrd_025121 [Cynara cardunculus var. scolymus]|uniref:Uncharacterized protein n=1 Tax=Cynara cardunculus var. scolymus TaxID=59895 RepID=A0A118JSC0_CYNCS|nr:hypothetical protein Ccrd_025121 [Cynara cardunculus var. scolymus]